MSQSIDRMFAYIAADEDGEGIAAHFMPGHGWMPMVGADMERMESLRPIAQQLANAGQKRIALVQFEDRRDLEYIEPDSEGDSNVIVINPGGKKNA